MEHWEFLIQKQGDRSWLPLESPDVEILEGRYRVVVRSSRPDIDVEVRVTHQSNSEIAANRRLQKQSRRTNSEGLMVVVPFTYLKPGVWELNCSGDLMSDFLGQNWQYAVQLQVLPREADSLGDEVATTSEVTPPPPTVSITEVAAINPEVQTVSVDPGTIVPAIAAGNTVDVNSLHDPLVTEEPSPPAPLTSSEFRSTRHQRAEQILQSLLESIMPEGDLDIEGGERGREGEELSFNTTPPPHLSTSQSSADFIPPSSSVESPFLLTLTQTTYVARRGQPLTISGQVEVATTQAGDAATQVRPLAAGELRICLSNPERGQVIFETRQSLANSQVLPSPFICSIEIPPDCQTQLILGQVSLYGNLPDDCTPAPIREFCILATQPFTIAADLEELLGAIATDRSGADPSTSPPTPIPSAQKQPATASAPLNLALLELVKQPKPSQPLRFQPATNQPLPPRIDPPKPVSSQHKLKLPKLQHQPAPVVEPVKQPEEPVVSAAIPEEPVASAATTLAPKASLSSDETDPPAPTGLNPLNEEKNVADESEGHDMEIVAPPNLLSAVDAAFQDLKLQHRFWTRLNAFAADAEFSEALKPEELETSDDSVDTAPSRTQVEVEHRADVQPPSRTWADSDWTREVVVDDEAPEPVRPPTGDRPTQPELPGSHLSLPKTSTEAEVVPNPKLEIQKGELIAGQAILVRVQLPQSHYRDSQIVVKLWVQDCQTRLLLDGPRSLDDLVPNGLGDLETTVELTVPQGYLEIRFEAIAVDLSTQQESHKVSIERAVIPPDLPVIQPLEDALPWNP